MFEQEVRRTLEYIARGMAVRIVAAPGGGRTTVTQKVSAEFEKGGVTVYSISGLRSHRRVPFGGIHSLGQEIRVGQLGVLGVADVLASRLTKPGERVLVVDDLEYVDPESIAVLDAVRRRTRRPMIVTMTESSLYTKGRVPLLGLGPEARVHLNPLRYEQVNELITEVLGTPADADATARVLAKSAGNPRLIVRIAETAALSGLLARRDGQWHMTNDTLWNEHLHSTVESLLEGLEADELTGLQTMAIAGTASIDVLQQVIKPDVLDRLEQRGFISVIDSGHNDISLAITPPVISDYFRGERMLTTRRVLANRITRTLSAEPQESNASASSGDSLTRVLAALRVERSSGDAATARHFHEQTAILERHRFELWDADRSVSNAAALLRVYWGSPIDASRIEQVLTSTPTADGDSGELLFFAISKALWAIYSGKGLNHAAAVLRSFAKEHPRRSAEADAFELFINASYDRMPQDLDQVLERLHERRPGSSVIASVEAILELYRFNPTGALAAVESSRDPGINPGIEPFIRGMAMFSLGRFEDAVVLALDKRAEARRDLDQLGVVSSTYVAAHALSYGGYLDEADYLMGSVFAMGRPGFLMDSLYDAMLRLAGLRTAASTIEPTITLATQARRQTEEAGPLPGMGKGVYNLVAGRPLVPAVFDRQAAYLVKGQLQRGYVLEAAQSALFLTCLLPGRKTLDLLREALRDHSITAHEQLVEIAATVVKEDHQSLDALLKKYKPDADLYHVRMLLRGAFKRYAFVDDSIGAAAMERAYLLFSARFPSAVEPLAFNSGSYSPLTVREIEVAALAGHRTNPEIAEHLGLSIRTVENHISNALRKTGSPTRSALFELVRDSLPFR